MPQPDAVQITAPAILTINGIKVANTQIAFSLRTNSGKTPSSEGLVVSVGFKMGDVTISEIAPIDGQNNRLIDAIFNDEIISAVFSHAGRNISIKGTFDEASKTSIVERGTTEGTFKFSGAVRKL